MRPTNTGMLVLLVATIAQPLWGQPFPPPQIQWQKGFGGSGNDDLVSIRQTTNGDFILAGGSDSPTDGTKSSTNCGNTDYWLILLDRDGNQVWEKSFGGTAYDLPAGVRQTSDGGFVVGGHSFSGANGNKTAPDYGQCDYWMVRMSTNGTGLWDVSFGGDAYEQMSGAAESVLQISNGGFAMLGYSMSASNGNKSAPNFGDRDFWLVRLDPNRSKLWDRSYGGLTNDWGMALAEAGDGGFVLGGHSASPPSGNKSSTNYGGYDFWIVRVDADGNKLWDKSFGGSNDDTLRCLVVTSDGGIAASGFTSSSASGSKTSTIYGILNAWVLRLDPDGNQLWEKTYGGNLAEGIYDMQETGDGGFVLCGVCYSGASGNKTSTNYGGSDYWILRLDGDGNKLWELALGGTNNDVARSIQRTFDGGFIVGGWSASGQSENKTVPTYGLDDYWVVKLAPEQPRLVPLYQTYDDVVHEGFRMLAMPGQTNLSYRLDYSQDLATWQPLQTNLAGAYVVPLTDGTATNGSQRFYRLQSLE